MDVGTIGELINKIGFPAFVSVYLLFFVSKTLQQILLSVGELTVAVKVLANLQDEDVTEPDGEDDVNGETAT